MQVSRPGSVLGGTRLAKPLFLSSLCPSGLAGDTPCLHLMASFPRLADFRLRGAGFWKIVVDFWEILMAYF